MERVKNFYDISGICSIESIATKKRKFLCLFVSNNKIFTYCGVLLKIWLHVGHLWSCALMTL